MSSEMTEAECMDDIGAELAEIHFESYGYYSDKSKLNKIVNGVSTYRCARCGEYKPKSDYYKDNRTPCGIRSKCKRCYHRD